jgi:hypothetical protein
LPNFTEIEKESLILNAVWDMVNGMVNFRTFVRLTKTEETNLMFTTSTDRELFNILLTDFLSQPQKHKGAVPFGLPTPSVGCRDSVRTYLFYLRHVCNNPILGKDSSGLLRVVEEFAMWLEGHSIVEKVWLSDIDCKLDMKIQRMAYIKICGNICKHNLARLEDNVHRLMKMMAENGRHINETEGYFMLPNFQEWFNENIFIAHSSVIAEMLNNLRWAIYEFLQPEFERTYTWLGEPVMYKFDVPAEIKHPLARAQYWELMHRMRSAPYFPQFTVSKYLRKVY